MDETGVKGLEEERRLAYVGITRAEMLCTVSFAANRRVYGQWQSALPSRFIDELPEAHVDVLTPPGLYGGGFGAAGMTGSSQWVTDETFHMSECNASAKALLALRQESKEKQGVTNPARPSVPDALVASWGAGHKALHTM